MSDPVIETAQQAITDSSPATHAGWAILGGIVLKVIEAIAKLFGSRKERAEADATEVATHLRVAEVATEALEAQREDTQQMRAQRDLAFDERDACKDALRKMDQRIAALESIHAGCGPRIAKLEGEQATAKKMLADLMGVTPTHNHTPDEVRAELARKET